MTSFDTCRTRQKFNFFFLLEILKQKNFCYLAESKLLNLAPFDSGLPIQVSVTHDTIDFGSESDTMRTALRETRLLELKPASTHVFQWDKYKEKLFYWDDTRL